MIAKIMKGSDFKGMVYYILNDEKGTKIIDADGLFLENNDTIAQGFIGQAQINPGVTKVVGHIALSFSKEDSPYLNNAVMAQIAREYMEKMGTRDRSISSGGTSTRSIRTCISLSTASTITARPSPTGTTASAANVSARSLPINTGFTSQMVRSR